MPHRASAAFLMSSLIISLAALILRGFASIQQRQRKLVALLESLMERSLQWSLLLHVLICGAYYLLRSRDIGFPQLAHLLIAGTLPAVATSLIVRFRETLIAETVAS